MQAGSQKRCLRYPGICALSSSTCQVSRALLAPDRDEADQTKATWIALDRLRQLHRPLIQHPHHLGLVDEGDRQVVRDGGKAVKTRRGSLRIHSNAR
jgi:hypothetical protein